MLACHPPPFYRSDDKPAFTRHTKVAVRIAHCHTISKLELRYLEAVQRSSSMDFVLVCPMGSWKEGTAKSNTVPPG